MTRASQAYRYEHFKRMFVEMLNNDIRDKLAITGKNAKKLSKEEFNMCRDEVLESEEFRMKINKLSKDIVGENIQNITIE